MSLPASLTGRKIFYAALDWGLGHATRSVPIIRHLLRNNKVILGVTPHTAQVFENEFPNLERLACPAYGIRYSAHWPLELTLLARWPRFHQVMAHENRQLRELVSSARVDTVVSDNRYGLYDARVHSILVTHQVFLKSQLFSRAAQSVNRRWLLRFNEIWVPDFEEYAESLSGELSHGLLFHPNVTYIGPQSRLIKSQTATENDYLFILSGPEPLRSQLELKLMRLSATLSATITIASGTNPPAQIPAGVRYFAFPSAKELSGLIAGARTIICRSGYSTLMDLFLLGKKQIILIPTPGQPEQEYLAGYWQDRFGAMCLEESRLTGETVKAMANKFNLA
jgi:hypothetical protein